MNLKIHRRLCFWLLLAYVLCLPALAAKSGREIYRQQCARCHGKEGEGVKGKYDEPLQGDWSLEKLTRVIDRTMPEDDPKQCVGADAAAVARYIYDRFYSLEARARRNPPRIELSRLTNRQYLNSVADLLGRFSESHIEVGSERGLQGVYYASRNFNREKKLYDRIDAEVKFDFGTGAPEGVVTNEFSIQWRGSVLAPETGTYEFAVKTPNGFRLWVNDEDSPLIDGWVASGDATEHKGAIKLIGGRAYPLRLDLFRFKDKTASITLLWRPPHGASTVIPRRHLTPDRAKPTFVVQTPFPPDDSSVGYERGVSVSKAWDEAVTQAAIETATHIIDNLDRLARTASQETNRLARARAFCARFAEAAFRRPLTRTQERTWVDAHFHGGTTIEEAVKRVVLLILKSPRFLYLDSSVAKPNDYHVAERLAYALWDSLPDEALLAEARAGKLTTSAEVQAQAERIIRDPRARAKIVSLLQQWLQMDHVEDITKDPLVYADFTPEVIGDLRTSLTLFLEEALWSEASDYRTLLLADYIFVNERLAAFFGVPAGAGADFAKARVNPEHRSGVLTHPYLLAAFSYARSSSPIHRGVFLTRKVIGRGLKPPPNAVAFKDSEFAPNLTMREKVTELTSSKACMACHSLINPLGFSLENFDGVGRFRLEENGKPINPTGDYLSDEGDKIQLRGARDVAQFAVSSDQAQNAFIEHVFHQLIKQPMLAYGRDVPNGLRRSFVASGFHMRRLMIEIATLHALHGVEKSGYALTETQPAARRD